MEKEELGRLIHARNTALGKAFRIAQYWKANGIKDGVETNHEWLETLESELKEVIRLNKEIEVFAWNFVQVKEAVQLLNKVQI